MLKKHRMSLAQDLITRAGNQCELCPSTEGLTPFAIPAAPSDGLDGHALICNTCLSQINDSSKADPNHWRCLNDSMWNQTPAVQVLAWRMLYRLRAEGWPQDLLDMMYVEEETKKWAKATELEDGEIAILHKDVNGNTLEVGDTVTLIQDLNVKGAGFTAKRGTAVRRISLVADNAAHIEGKINGQHIVILTKYVKKQKG